MRRYVPNNRRVLEDHEPCTITPEVVAEHLERTGNPRMAAWARAVGTADARTKSLMDALRSHVAKLTQRLEKYEPWQPYKPEPRPEYGE